VAKLDDCGEICVAKLDDWSRFESYKKEKKPDDS